jgi:MarR family transcriptional regulator, organic hydroperoxide resistance regulator
MDDLAEWGTARLLTVAARLVEQDCNARLAEWDLTHSGLVLLTALLSGPVTQRDLGAVLLLEDQAISRAIDRLERAGHVRRNRDTRDRRRVRVGLTPGGRTACLLAAGTGACGEHLDREVGQDRVDPAVLRRALVGIIDRHLAGSRTDRNVR